MPNKFTSKTFYLFSVDKNRLSKQRLCHPKMADLTPCRTAEKKLIEIKAINICTSQRQ